MNALTAPPARRAFLVMLPLEVADSLEDLRYLRQRRERRRITKRQLVEEAIRRLVQQQPA